MGEWGGSGGKTNSKKRNPEFSISTERVALVHLPVLPHATGEAEGLLGKKSVHNERGGGGEGQWQEVRLKCVGGGGCPAPALC